MNNIFTHNTLDFLDNYIPTNSGVYVIMDKNLSPYKSYFSKYNIIEIATSEESKNFHTVAAICEQLLEMGADRDCFIIGVGGGIASDIAGFVGSIYKRGVRFGFVATTLLSQSDASIGGKNGVNLNSYKNIIGTITQPEFIYICSDVLKTLPPREFKSGIAEVLKTFILFDKSAYNSAVEYFTKLEEHLVEKGTYMESETSNKIFGEKELTDLLDFCAKYKAGVVERDEFERGERRLLNLGHTFAHAIEKTCGDEGVDVLLTHGEAVSIGMVLAAKVAYLISPESCEKGFANKVETDLKKVGLPVDLPNGMEIKELVKYISKDKKVSGKSIHFILPFSCEKVADVDIELSDLDVIANDLC